MAMTTVLTLLWICVYDHLVYIIRAERQKINPLCKHFIKSLGSLVKNYDIISKILCL